MFQQELFPDKNPATVYLVEGELTPWKIMFDYGNREEIEHAILTNPELVEKELERAIYVLAKKNSFHFPCLMEKDTDETLVEYLMDPWKEYSSHRIPAPMPELVARESVRRLRMTESSFDTVGYVELTQGAAIEFFPENFYPHVWMQHAEQLQDRRRIYTYEATRRDGSKAKIVIKGQKQAYSSRCSKYDELFCDNLELYKTAISEFNNLRDIINNNGKTEVPLGYFYHGKEQWLYTQFVDGENPLDVLKQNSMREEFWMSDCALMVALCKTGLRHMGFYDKAFDDKKWDNGMTLIDVDEDILLVTPTGHHREDLNLDAEFKQACTGFLQDCLVSYQRQGQMTRDEARMYATAFASSMGLHIDVECVSQPRKDSYMTLEEHTSLMSDCD